MSEAGVPGFGHGLDDGVQVGVLEVETGFAAGGALAAAHARDVETQGDGAQVVLGPTVRLDGKGFGKAQDVAVEDAGCGEVGHGHLDELKRETVGRGGHGAAFGVGVAVDAG